jgi:hypothetical protein
MNRQSFFVKIRLKTITSVISSKKSVVNEILFRENFEN